MREVFGALYGPAIGDKMNLRLFLGDFMATESLQRLRSEMLALSKTDRAALAHDLIRSLDAPQDEGVAGAWDREIERRIAEIDAGQAELIDRAEFRRRMRAKLESG